MNTKLLLKIDEFVNKLNLTVEIQKRLKELLIRYEFCRLKKKLNYPIDIQKINKNEFNKHLIGFIDGDGCLRSGKRKGSRPGLYRFSPNITLELHSCDKEYLNLILEILELNIKKVSESRTRNSCSIIVSSEWDLDILMKYIDNNQLFLSEKRNRDYKLFKELVNYNKGTKLITHNESWLNKGLEIIKDLNTYNNLENKETYLDFIKENLTIEYIIGFIEAEGSLVLHYNTKKENIFNSFEITQVTVNNSILKGILSFIDNYNDPLIIKENTKIKTKGITYDNSKSRKQQLSRLILTNNDVLFNKILPILLSTNMYSKMQINLIYWMFGVIICKDLKNIEECVKLYFEIKEEINSNSSNLLNLDYILTILNKYL